MAVISRFPGLRWWRRHHCFILLKSQERATKAQDLALNVSINASMYHISFLFLVFTCRMKRSMGQEEGPSGGKTRLRKQAFPWIRHG